MSVIDNAIAILQAHALACSSSDVTIKAAPSYPIDDAARLPISIAHIISGQGTAMNATDLQMEVIVAVDFHFNRTHLKDAYTKIDALIPLFLKRLGGDPTLADTIDTIQFPVTFEVTPAQWDTIVTQLVSFQVPMKTLETPTT